MEISRKRVILQQIKIVTNMNATQIKKGEKLSATYYLTVVENRGNGEILVEGNGGQFVIKGKKLIEDTLNSATQYSKEEKVNRTQMVEALEGAGDSVFQVVFDKQDNTERTLIGHLINSEQKMGRTNCYDLEVTSGHPMRLVDNRTIKSLVLKGVKYTLKK